MSLLGDNTVENTPKVVGGANAEYNAINGLEIRKIAAKQIREFADRVENLQSLKEALAFHRAEMELAWRLKCYPADTPVPKPITDSFIMQQEDFNESKFNEAKTNLDKARNLSERMDAEIARLLKAKKEVDEFISNGEVVIQDIETVSDNGRPDQLRMENDLPIRRTKHTGAQLAEVEEKVTLNLNKEK